MTTLISNVTWGGNTTEPPKDTPACGFNDEYCQPVPVFDTGNQPVVNILNQIENSLAEQVIK